jgi:hypothetical protein
VAAPSVATNDAVLMTLPATVLEEPGDSGLAAEIDAREVHFLHALPDVEVGDEDRVILGRRDAGVVETHVEAAEAVDGGVVHGIDFARFGDVGVHVESADLTCDRLPRLVAQVDDDDARALAGESACTRPADPAGGSRDDCNLAVEASHDAWLLCS